MPTSHTDCAVILRARAYGEVDKIVTFFTEEAGKLTGIAKGAKNSRRRFANCLDPLTHVRMYYRTRFGATLVFMERCDLLQPPGAALADPLQLAYGSYLLELVERLTIEAQPLPTVYALLVEGLEALRHGAATSGLLRTFELRVLAATGYDPQLLHCGRCRTAFRTAGDATLDPVAGSFRCLSCRESSQDSLTFSGHDLAALDALKAMPLVAARPRHLPDTATPILSALIALHLTRPLESVKLIAAMKDTGRDQGLGIRD